MVAGGVHEVDAFGELARRLLGSYAGVPEMKCAIPGTSDDSI